MPFRHEGGARQCTRVLVLYLPVSDAMEIDVGGTRITSTSTTGFLGDMSQFEKLVLHEDRSHIGMAFEKSAMIQQLSELLEGLSQTVLNSPAPLTLRR